MKKTKILSLVTALTLAVTNISGVGAITAKAYADPITSVSITYAGTDEGVLSRGKDSNEIYLDATSFHLAKKRNADVNLYFDLSEVIPASSEWEDVRITSIVASEGATAYGDNIVFTQNDHTKGTLTIKSELISNGTYAVKLGTASKADAFTYTLYVGENASNFGYVAAYDETDKLSDAGKAVDYTIEKGGERTLKVGTANKGFDGENLEWFVSPQDGKVTIEETGDPYTALVTVASDAQSAYKITASSENLNEPEDYFLAEFDVKVIDPTTNIKLYKVVEPTDQQTSPLEEIGKDNNDAYVSTLTLGNTPDTITLVAEANSTVFAPDFRFKNGKRTSEYVNTKILKDYKAGTGENDPIYPYAVQLTAKKATPVADTTATTLEKEQLIVFDQYHGAEVTMDISVVENELTDITIAPKNSTEATESKSIEAGSTCELEIKTTPVNAIEPEVTWYSSDTSVAVVDDYGEVTGIKSGTATIYAVVTSTLPENQTLPENSTLPFVKDDKTILDDFGITVISAIADMEFDNVEYSINKGKAIENLKPTITNIDGSESDLSGITVTTQALGENPADGVYLVYEVAANSNVSLALNNDKTKENYNTINITGDTAGNATVNAKLVKVISEGTNKVTSILKQVEITVTVSVAPTGIALYEQGAAATASPVTSGTIDLTNPTTIALEAKLTAGDDTVATSESVAWKSSVPGVATVAASVDNDKLATITGVSTGTCYVTASINGLTARFKVTVKKSVTAGADLTLKVGSTDTNVPDIIPLNVDTAATYEITPKFADGYTNTASDIEWTISSTKVATISKTSTGIKLKAVGTTTAGAVGTATLTAKIKNVKYDANATNPVEEYFTVTHTVNVTVPADSIKLTVGGADVSAFELQTIDEATIVVPVLYRKDGKKTTDSCTNANVAYTLGEVAEPIAECSYKEAASEGNPRDGSINLKGIKAGDTSITVKYGTAQDAPTSTYTVAVFSPVTDMSLNKTKSSLKVGDSVAVRVNSVAPANYIGATIDYVAFDENYDENHPGLSEPSTIFKVHGQSGLIESSVSSDGTFVAVKAGKAKIVARYTLGDYVAYSNTPCVVDVTNYEFTGLTISRTEDGKTTPITGTQYVYTDETLFIQADYASEKATVTDIEWKSDKPSIASVSLAKTTIKDISDKRFAKVVAGNTPGKVVIKATVTAESEDGGLPTKTRETQFDIIVKAKPTLTGFTGISSTENNYVIIGSELTLDPTWAVADSFNSKEDRIVYNSNAESVAIDDDGKLIAKATGTATIKACVVSEAKPEYNWNNPDAQFTVVVEEPAFKWTKSAQPQGRDTDGQTPLTEVSLSYGETGTLEFVTPSGLHPAASELEWSSDNSSVVTVEETGDGEATITAIANSGVANVSVIWKDVSVKKQVKFTVATVADEDEINIEIDSKNFIGGKLWMQIGDQEEITISTNNPGTTIPRLVNIIPTGDVDAVEITQTTLDAIRIEAKKVGEVTITGKFEGGITKTVTVEVIDDPVLSETAINLTKGESKELTFVTSNGVGFDVLWASSDDKIATVDQNGKVTAVANSGKATISVFWADLTGKKQEAKCVVNVSTKTSTIALSKTALELEVGQSEALAVTIENGTYANLVWSSSNPAVASVTDGTVRGIGVGDAVITVTADGLKAECTVKVTGTTVYGTDGVTYAINDDGVTARVISIPAGAGKEVTIDKISIGGVTYPVTIIATGAIKDNTTIKTLNIGSSVLTIEANAIVNAKKLKTYNITPNKNLNVVKGAITGSYKKAKVNINVKSKKLYKKAVKKFKNGGLKKASYAQKKTKK